MDYELLKVEHDGPIGRIIMNRPEKLNAVPIDSIMEFPEAIDELTEDEDVRVIIMKGAGRAWSAGFDFNPGPRRGIVRAYQDSAGEALEGRRWLEGMFRIWDCPKPVIAQLHGWAAGIASILLLFTDLRYATPEFKCFYASGNTGSYLPEVWYWFIGLTGAKEYSLRPDHPFTAEEMLRMGVLNRIYPAEKLEAEVESIAAEMAKTHPLFLQLQKLGLNRLHNYKGFKEHVLAAKDFDVMLHYSVPGRANFDRLRELGGDRRKMAEEQSKVPDYWKKMDELGKDAPPHRV
ncbi:enoyl-CoA hydratase/isomerase family protein [Dehalococcoidia bacterium]|nr:enoyl-CoA hydratase/isomerase family protein [Dehalococcoidia bacterium]